MVIRRLRATGLRPQEQDLLAVNNKRVSDGSRGACTFVSATGGTRVGSINSEPLMRAKTFIVSLIGVISLVTLVSESGAAVPTAVDGGVQRTHAPLLMADAGSTHGNTNWTQSTRGMTRVDELRFANLSPTTEVRAATLDNGGQSHNSLQDLLSLALVGVMLVAYQLFRKHRLLRQQPFNH